MTMLLSQEQELLKDSAIAFLAEEAPVAQQRRLRDEKVKQGFDDKTWQQMVEMGWPVAVLPEEHDGLAAGYLGLGSVFEAIGRNLSAQPLLSQAVLAPELLIRAGSAAQQAQWLPLLASGVLPNSTAPSYQPVTIRLPLASATTPPAMSVPSPPQVLTHASVPSAV